MQHKVACRVPREVKVRVKCSFTDNPGSQSSRPTWWVLGPAWNFLHDFQKQVYVHRASTINVKELLNAAVEGAATQDEALRRTSSWPLSLKSDFMVSLFSTAEHSCPQDCFQFHVAYFKMFILCDTAKGQTCVRHVEATQGARIHLHE